MQVHENKKATSEGFSPNCRVQTASIRIKRKQSVDGDLRQNMIHAWHIEFGLSGTLHE